MGGEGFKVIMLLIIGSYSYLTMFCNMPTKIQTIERLVRKQGNIRARDLKRRGLPSVYLGRLVRQGRLVRRARGVYALLIRKSAARTIGNSRAAPAPRCALPPFGASLPRYRHPKSAGVWMAIDVKAWRPRRA